MARTDFVEGSPLTRDALAFAADRHAGQTRDMRRRALRDASGRGRLPAARGRLLGRGRRRGCPPRACSRTPTSSARSSRAASASAWPALVAVGQRRPVDRGRRRAQGRPAAAGRRGGRGGRGDLRRRQGLEDARAARSASAAASASEGDRAKLDHYRASLEMLAGLMPGLDLLDRLRAELERSRLRCWRAAAPRARGRAPLRPSASPGRGSSRRRAAPAVRRRSSSACRGRDVPLVEHGRHAAVLEQAPAAVPARGRPRRAPTSAPAPRPRSTVKSNSIE